MHLGVTDALRFLDFTPIVHDEDEDGTWELHAMKVHDSDLKLHHVITPHAAQVFNLIDAPGAGQIKKDTLIELHGSGPATFGPLLADVDLTDWLAFLVNQRARQGPAQVDALLQHLEVPRPPRPREIELQP